MVTTDPITDTGDDTVSPGVQIELEATAEVLHLDFGCFYVEIDNNSTMAGSAGFLPIKCYIQSFSRMDFFTYYWLGG